MSFPWALFHDLYLIPFVRNDPIRVALMIAPTESRAHNTSPQTKSTNILESYARQEQGTRTRDGGVPQRLLFSLKRFLRALCDSGQEVIAGEGLDEGHFWVLSDGVEYFVSIRKSARQLLKDGVETH